MKTFKILMENPWPYILVSFLSGAILVGEVIGPNLEARYVKRITELESKVDSFQNKEFQDSISTTKANIIGQPHIE